MLIVFIDNISQSFCSFPLFDILITSFKIIANLFGY